MQPSNEMKFHIHVYKIIGLAGILTDLSWTKYVQAGWWVAGGQFVPAQGYPTGSCNE